MQLTTVIYSYGLWITITRQGFSLLSSLGWYFVSRHKYIIFIVILNPWWNYWNRLLTCSYTVI